MPSERFFKLDTDKQERVIEASVNEFAKEGLQNSSINQIIKDADISRGSFYTYFADKSDLFSFIFRKLKDTAIESILDAVKKADGDIFVACRNLIDMAIKIDKKKTSISVRLYNSLFTDFNIVSHIGEKKDEMLVQDDAMKKLFDDIYKLIDKDRYNITRKQFDDVADLLITISLKALITAKRIPTLESKCIKTLFNEYDIIEKGLRY